MNCRSIGSREFAINRRFRAPADLARGYDAASAKWVQIARSLQLENTYREALVASNVLSVIGDRATGARVLDCGIGSGSLSLALNNIVNVKPVFCGIDVSNEMLGVADVEMRQAGMTPELQQANILSIPHVDQSFDLVMAAHVLEHLPEPQLALEEMIRVLRPGGVLFVCITRPSVFGAIVQLLWRTWAVTEKQGVAWLRNCQLNYIGYRPINLGHWAGRGSTAFWAQKPNEGSKKPKHVSSTSAEACLL
jgi:demethylmenaquinone methyltransferase/2-methoxy-6-polyprenyl-1,4-benzoquinol methylase